MNDHTVKMLGNVYIFLTQAKSLISSGQVTQLQRISFKKSHVIQNLHSQYVVFMKRTLKIYLKFALRDVTKWQDPCLLIVWSLGSALFLYLLFRWIGVF